MNELFFPAEGNARRCYKTMFKRLVSAAAGSCALGGLSAWVLDHTSLRIERLDMPLAGLGEAFDGRKIAHISDLHCSPIVREGYLRHCVQIINAMEVDFVAVTGDLITGARTHAAQVARILGLLRPGIATLVCLGNHDYGVWHPRGKGGIPGLAGYLTRTLGLADVFVLANESLVFRRDGQALQFVGVHDYWTPFYDPDLAFDAAEADVPTIALCHNPDGAHDMAERGAQWTLAGHTHGNGKPKTVLHDFVLPKDHAHYIAGHYRLDGRNHLYVNRGLGYAFRKTPNTRPEITVFTLRQG